MVRGVSTDTADEPDSRGQALADRMKEASEHLQNKMVRTRDLIKQEQKSRDGELYLILTELWPILVPGLIVDILSGIVFFSVEMGFR